jgi:hypothetical protein
MRSVVVCVAVGAFLWVNGAHAGSVEVKGIHLCCNNCVKQAGGILSKVEGVSDAKCDRDSKTVTFSAKDSKSAAAGVKALMDGGFFGTATEDGKDIKVAAAAPKSGEKANEVTVTQVHVCCKSCQTAIAGLFKGAEVEYSGVGPQKAVKVTGKDLDKAEVLATLRKAGFNGTVEK